MAYTCPACGSTDTETTEDDRGYCEGCRLVFTPTTTGGLIDPPVRVRRDLE